MCVRCTEHMHIFSCVYPWLASWLSRNMEYLECVTLPPHWDLWLLSDKCYGFPLCALWRGNKPGFGKSSAQSWAVGAVIEVHCQEWRGGCCLGLKEDYSEIIHWGKAGELQLLHDGLQHYIMSSNQKCSSAAALTVWGEIILGTELASGHCHFMVI